MKKTIIAGLTAALAAWAAPASAQTQQEIGYPAGSLGYAAIMQGDMQAARKAIAASKVSANDPALMLNAAYVAMQSGRFGEAERLLHKVAAAPESVELVLASGKEVDSRAAARMALMQLNQRLAVR